MAYFQTLNVNGQHRHKKGVNEEPVGDQNYDSESAELTYSATREERNGAQDGVVGAQLQRVGGPSIAQTFCYALFDRKSYRCLDDCVYLEDPSMPSHMSDVVHARC